MSKKNLHQLLCETEGSYCSYNSNKRGAIDLIFIPRRKKRQQQTDDKIRYFSDSLDKDFSDLSAKESLRSLEAELDDSQN